MKISQHLQSLQPSYIREILSAASAQDVVSLAGGLPDSEHLPVKLLTQALSNLQATPEVFQYGETAGYPALLEYLSGAYELGADAKLLITNGSQQGLDLIARAFLDPDDVVVMEAPSYLGALQVFGLAKATIVSVAQTATGPNLEQLKAVFETRAPKLFYAVPDFHNPTGVRWTVEVRKNVAQLCRQYGVALIEDAPYRELSFSGQHYPLASSFCPDLAITLRSFSKISSPGLRLGAVSGPQAWISSLVKVKQAADLHTSLPVQASLLTLLQHPSFPKHLDTIRTVYAQRCQTLGQQLAEKLPNCYFKNVQGGMFLWLTLPDLDTMAFAKQALLNGVAVVPSNVFYADQEHASPALRLNFSNSNQQQLALGVERLSSTLEHFN